MEHSNETAAVKAEESLKAKNQKIIMKFAALLKESSKTKKIELMQRIFVEPKLLKEENVFATLCKFADDKDAEIAHNARLALMFGLKIPAWVRKFKD